MEKSLHILYSEIGITWPTKKKKKKKKKTQKEKLFSNKCISSLTCERDLALRSYHHNRHPVWEKLNQRQPERQKELIVMWIPCVLVLIFQTGKQKLMSTFVFQSRKRFKTLAYAVKVSLCVSLSVSHTLNSPFKSQKSLCTFVKSPVFVGMDR